MSSPAQPDLVPPAPLVRRCLERARQIHRVPDDAFARAIAETSRIYTRSRDDIARFSSAPWALAARLGFFLPRDLAKVAGPLAALARGGALPPGRTWRVLDLGAGLGATSLGVACFAARTGAVDRLCVVAVDRDPVALAELASLARDAASLGLVPVDAETRVADLFSPASWKGGPFDLVVLGLAINEREAERPAKRADAGSGVTGVASLLAELARALAPGGAVLVVEPALRETTRALQRVRDAIAAAGAPHVYWPCPHALPCPMLPNERDWCHAELPLVLPPALAALAGEAGLRDERLTYAALVLRNEPGHEALLAARAAPGRPLRLVSAPLFTKGKVEAIGCAPEGRLVRLMRLDRHRTDANAGLSAAHRGDGLVIATGADAEAERGAPVARAEAEGARVRLDAASTVHVTASASPTPHPPAAPAAEERLAPPPPHG